MTDRLGVVVYDDGNSWVKFWKENYPPAPPPPPPLTREVSVLAVIYIPCTDALRSEFPRGR